MTASTLSLADFLLARIAEDEETAREAGRPDGGEWSCRRTDQPEFHIFGDFGWAVRGADVETHDSEWGKVTADHIAGHDPARVLAECAAKRRIVETCRAVEENPDWWGDHDMADYAELCDTTLRALASVYAEHPEYPLAPR